MADVNRGNRPLSPHLQIYRPQLTSVSSILVRITGIAVLLLSIFVVAWLIAAAGSATSFAAVDGFLRSWFGDLMLFFGTWALFYHLFGRLRHVLWDFGHFVEVDISQKMFVAAVIAATVLTLLVAILF